MRKLLFGTCRKIALVESKMKRQICGMNSEGTCLFSLKPSHQLVNINCVPPVRKPY